MIQDPLALFIVLTGIVGAIFAVSEWKFFQPLFRFLPPVVFCYFVPMLATTAGFLPAKSPLYDLMNSVLLYPVLVLLLLSANYRAIMRLGPVALGLMLVGTVAAALAAAASVGERTGTWRVDPPGGTLQVDLTPEQAYLTGPAVIVAHGKVAV